jgi:hypothetical protein
MIEEKRFIMLVILILFFSNFCINNCLACKDIIACGNATEDDYNLLMKVRDPSRPGLQVLCIVPEEYEYNYFHPRNGNLMSFSNNFKYIGVATIDDIIPNLVKPGMTLCKTGLCFGDADTNSMWINRGKFAWDDFDLIRYACEKAKNEKEAVYFLTKEIVDKFHATSVSENFFIVGPNTGYVVEADAYRYHVKEVKNGVVVMHNYPKELWRSQWKNLLPLSRYFDKINEKTVLRFGTIRLGSLYGIRVVDINNDSVSIKLIGPYYRIDSGNIGLKIEVKIGERKTIGRFSVELLGINNRKANIRIKNIFKAWEEEMLNYINQKYGHITVMDMMNWSRLHREDVNGLRGMCQEINKYESVAIYSIPKEDYEIFGLGWFSPNHACSSIYVPFHISNNKIFRPYENGEAAQICLDLMNLYPHKILSENFSKTENIFIEELHFNEKIAKIFLNSGNDIDEFLTIIDNEMQRQAYLTEQLWLIAAGINNEKLFFNLASLWESNYSETLENLDQAFFDLMEIPKSEQIQKKFIEIALSICESRINSTECLIDDIEIVKNEMEEGRMQLKNGDFHSGFKNIQKSYSNCTLILEGKLPVISNTGKNKSNHNSIFLFYSLLSITIIFIIVYFIFTKKH